MKKTLIITLADGQVIKKDITFERLRNSEGGEIPIGAPANDEAYANMCWFIANNGLTDADHITPTHLRYIAPSQIKCVEVKFG